MLGVTFPRGLMWAAGACFEAAALLPLATWPAVIGPRADSGGGRGQRGGLLRYSW